MRRITEPPNLTAIIQSRRLSTFGHIAHVDDDADAKMILTAPHQTTGRDHQGVLVQLNPCAPLCTLSGDLISWVDELRYLDVIIMRSRAFKCSLHHAKKLFYRSANAIFGEIGRIASEEVVLQLIISKCMSVILYGLEACPLTKSDLLSMDFVIDRFFMKLFKTSNINNV